MEQGCSDGLAQPHGGTRRYSAAQVGLQVSLQQVDTLKRLSTLAKH